MNSKSQKQEKGSVYKKEDKLFARKTDNIKKKFYVIKKYSKGGLDKENCLLEFLMHQKRKKNKNEKINIYSQILEKNPFNSLSCLRKNDLFCNKKSKEKDNLDKNKNNKIFKKNNSYKTCSLKKQELTKDIKNENYFNSLSKLEHRLMKYYKRLKNNENYLDSFSINEIISNYKEDLKLNKTGFKIKSNIEFHKNSFCDKIQKQINNSHKFSKDIIYDDLKKKLTNHKFKEYNIKSELKNLSIAKNKEKNQANFPELTQHQNEINNKELERSLQNKRFSIFLQAKKNSIQPKKQIKNLSLSNKRNELEKIISPQKFMKNIRNISLQKLIKDENLLQSPKLGHIKIKNKKNPKSSTFLMNQLIINLKTLEEKKERQKTYCEKKMQTAESKFENKQFSNIFKNYIKEFLKQNVQGDFEIKNIFKYFKKHNFCLGEVDHQSQKLIKVYFDSFQKQIIFDEIRKILNEENIYIEDFFQNAFENLHNKFMEENSKEYSQDNSNTSSNFTITNFEENKITTSLDSRFSLFIKNDQKEINHIFNSCQNGFTKLTDKKLFN